jgi:hypothetical protein
MAASDTRVVEDTRRVGAVAAFGIAAMPVYFILPRVVGTAFGAQDPTGAGLDSQVAAIVAHPNVYGSLGLASLIVGASFVILALALHDHLRATAPFAARVATAAGVIGGSMFLLAGFVPLAVAEKIVTTDAQDHAAAVALYLTGQSVTGSLTNASTVLFGVFAGIASRAGARAGLLPRALSYLGVLLGIAFPLVLLLPGALYVAILIMLVWSAWLGVALLRGERRVAPTPGAATPARA